ncbi:hypothetical protein IQ255_23270 [Pleurocapsales cyanobacterium LEGE 10410]|nr:hypothetical protein [Pleurocapsales cyanobacterium LEGE 10410]
MDLLEIIHAGKPFVLVTVINVLLLEAFALCCEATRPRCFAFLAIGMFLAINGFLLKVEPTEAVNTMLALAAGDLTELDLASWIEKFIDSA